MRGFFYIFGKSINQPLIMKTNHLLKAFVLFMFSYALSAQEGTNDPTFNPGDNSLGTTTDGPVDNFIVCPDGKLIIYGGFEKYHDVDSYNIVRINPDKSIDASFNVGTALNKTVTAAVLQSDGKIVVAGDFTQYNDIPVGNVIRLNSDGSLDTSFVGGMLDNYVWEMKVQADDKVLLCGAFTAYNNDNVKKVIRLNTNGTLDTTFNLTEDYYYVIDIAIQADGKILIPGFSSGGGELVRVNTDGSRDTSFLTVFTDFDIRAIDLQPDGKIVIGGRFSRLNFQTHRGVARINANGAKDTTFAIGTGFIGAVTDLAIQPDGKIIFVGWITNYGDYFSKGAIRFNGDGTVDTSFDAPATEPDDTIFCVALTANNIYIGGMLINYNSSPVNYLLSLNYDGTRNYTGHISPTGADNPVTAIADAGNGNMLVGGLFNHYNGQPQNKLALIDQNGVLLEGFNQGQGPNGVIKSIIRQSDGKYIIYGDFGSYNGVNRTRVARLNADGSLDESYDLSSYFAPYNLVNGCKLQPDGKLVVYGGFQIAYENSTSSLLACRFNVDGTLDQGFRLLASSFYTRSYLPLEYLEISPDGKMLLSLDQADNGRKIGKVNSDGSVDVNFPFIGGDYYSNTRTLMSDNNGKFITSQLIYNGENIVPTTLYRRMNANGIYDTDFTLSADDYGGLAFIQGDGKMFFIKGNGLTYSFKRFNTDGTLDETFDTHVIYEWAPSVKAVYYQEDKIVVGGRFSRYDNNHRSNIMRMNSTGAALLTSSPEVKVKASLMVLKKNNTIDVECLNVALSSVAIYDLSGKLIANSDNINDNTVSLKYTDITDSVLIVKAKLQDGRTLVKKIM